MDFNAYNMIIRVKLVRFAHNWPPARRVAPTPRRECWQNGIVGSGLMQCWINDPFLGGIDDKIKMAVILLKTNIPVFHHSIIPFSGQIRKPQNI
jgi:hypothetical protein